MSRQLTGDIFLLIGQQLLAQKDHKSLSNLSLTSKDNYQLLTPLVYRHIILTDHSLPTLFSRITEISHDDRQIMFEKIQDGEEDNLLSKGLHPIKRLKVHLQYAHKIIIDTNKNNVDFEKLSAIAKVLDTYLDDLMFPNVSRLIFTAKHGTTRRVGLFASDHDTYELPTFLPMACNPKYICCSFDKTTPACDHDTLIPHFALTKVVEVVNIHQAKHLVAPVSPVSSRVSFSGDTCSQGDDCPRRDDPDHPKVCIRAHRSSRMHILLDSIEPLPHTSCGHPHDRPSPHQLTTCLTIIERTGKSDPTILSYENVALRLTDEDDAVMPVAIQSAQQLLQIFNNFMPGLAVPGPAYVPPIGPQMPAHPMTVPYNGVNNSTNFNPANVTHHNQTSAAHAVNTTQAPSANTNTNSGTTAWAGGVTYGNGNPLAIPSSAHQSTERRRKSGPNYWSTQIQFVSGEEAEKEPVCEACGEPI
ncbi:uncharacterized protein I303_102592 [Kwoniella dejecticola CBS 10117]|uniref:Uncharacterized protein n=1 Tax=Kwoniella dejecticola CBS 10117 TaxID=1296121 RepID=A0A1A6A964_9TREE|nr:uncharacterized protein I303_02607 [Kwoniella dejecticola CBS 10117]OBR86598.1 hypothetical protein I303_02607 [Kwoniella dejecticola CBS 10117]